MSEHVEDEMDLSSAIRDAGMKAVLEAYEISRPEQENEIREEFLSALMARNLHRTLAKPVRVEVPYTVIYGELVPASGVPVDILKKIGGYRADITVYEQEGALIRPTAIVEIKKFAEGANASSIFDDLHKGDSVELGKHLPIYAGVFVCQTSGSLQDRKEALQNALGHRIVFSDAKDALKGDWQWCFGCAWT
jgi:hypothetical protein